MVDEGHGPECPGCAAAPLTAEDREWLSRHGWAGPRHVIPPGPLAGDVPAPVLSWVVGAGFVVACGVFLLIPMWPTAAMVVALLLFVGLPAVILWWRVVHDHAEPVDGCVRCRWRAGRERHQHWARYRRLLAEEQRRLERQRAQQHRQAMQEAMRVQVEQAQQRRSVEYQRLLREQRDRELG